MVHTHATDKWIVISLKLWWHFPFNMAVEEMTKMNFILSWCERVLLDYSDELFFCVGLRRSLEIRPASLAKTSGGPSEE